MPKPIIGDTYTDDSRNQWTVEAVTDIEQDFYLVEIAPPDDPTAMSIELTPDEWADFLNAHRFIGSSQSAAPAA